MKTLLSIVLVLIFASVASAQPPRGGKFGAGEGQFGDPAKMAEMRENMRQRWQQDATKENQVPGPPPWAGQGMRRGAGGPPSFFLDRGPQSTTSESRTNLRRRNSKNEISRNSIDHRGRGRQFRNQNHSHERSSPQKQKSRSYNKNITIIIIK